jgi:hypothetical protein
VAEARKQREVLEHDESVNYVDWPIHRQRHEAYAARRGPRGVITMDD